MPKVLDPAKKITDEVAIRHLNKQGKIAENWEFWHDYGSHYDAQGNKRKEFSPYAKFYRNTDNLAERMMVVSGLPMVDGDGLKNVPKWEETSPGKFKEKNNLFKATIDGTAVTLIVRNDQPTGIPKNARLDFSPQLFLNGVELIGSTPVLLPVDPKNSNYLNNTLEWDYGVCKRHFRQVEGRVHGYWIFPANPGGDVRIVYNQTGDYRLRLGRYKVNEDEEFISASVFASAVYPFAVDDSATYYPDANPETTSVDGHVGDDSYFATGTTWATLIAAAGNDANDSEASDEIIDMAGFTSSNTYKWLYRSLYLFDSSALPNTATVTAATLSIYGSAGTEDGLSATPNVNIYTSTPPSNTALATGDFTQIGSTAQSTAIAYGSWSGAGYNDFALNDMTQISLTGVSKFGARNANYDVAASAPPWVSGARSRIFGYFSEQGDGYKPKLIVTYTVPTTYESTATSSIVMAENTATQMRMEARVIDTTVFADSNPNQMSMSGNAVDSIIFTEIANAIGTLGAITADTIVIADSDRAGLSYQGLAADALAMADSVSGTYAVGITVTDTLVTGDSTGTVCSLEARAIDGGVLSDGSIGSLIIQSVATDTIALADVVQAQLEALARAIDTFAVSDSGVAGQSFTVTVQDNIQLATVLSAIMHFYSGVADSIVITDIASSQKLRTIAVRFKFRSRSLTMKLG